MIPVEYETIEDKVLQDYICRDDTTETELQNALNRVKTDTYNHYFNPLHVFCRLVDYYGKPKDKAYDYAKNRYEQLFK